MEEWSNLFKEESPALMLNSSDDDTKICYSVYATIDLYHYDVMGGGG